jgi:hypothetical protein
MNHYLRGKITVDLGEEFKQTYKTEKTTYQSIEDIKEWQEEIFDILPEAYKKFGTIELFVKRHYNNLNIETYNPDWIKVKEI